jgi:predicted transcriptional regulator
MRKPWTSRKRIVVPDAELAVLKVLWERGAATIREVMEVLYPEGDTSDYATVQKLLDRLQDRGCVSRQRDARTNVYRATVDRDHLLREQLHEAAEKLCEGSLTPLLTQLVDAKHLSAEDIKTLRALVDRLDRKESER